jgi:hypothetical protein
MLGAAPSSSEQQLDLAFAFQLATSPSPLAPPPGYLGWPP